MAKRWTEEEIDFLKEWYPKEGAGLCAEVLDRTIDAVRIKTCNLNIKTVYGKKPSIVQYIDEANLLGYKVLDNYIDTHTKLNHLHLSCGYTWSVRPSDLKRGINCPNCSNAGKIPTSFYWIYFPELDLHKIGITTNIKQRHSNFGYKAIVKHLVNFDNRRSAYGLEQYYLSILKSYMLNTGELNSGNTETFIWPT